MMSAIVRASFKEMHRRRMRDPSIGLAVGHVVIALFLVLCDPFSSGDWNILAKLKA